MISLNIKCKDRPPYIDTLWVQDGWNSDGTRKMIEVPAVNSKSCRFDLRAEEAGCQGCRWQHQMDLRDLVPGPAAPLSLTPCAQAQEALHG